MPAKQTADERDRWVMVTISREDLRRLQRRRDALNGGVVTGEPGKATTDSVASTLLAWAIETATEPLP